MGLFFAQFSSSCCFHQLFISLVLNTYKHNKKKSFATSHPCFVFLFSRMLNYVLKRDFESCTRESNSGQVHHLLNTTILFHHLCVFCCFSALIHSTYARDSFFFFFFYRQLLCVLFSSSPSCSRTEPFRLSKRHFMDFTGDKSLIVRYLSVKKCSLFV